MELHGKFETVSSDVRLLSTKIEQETQVISKRLNGLPGAILEKVEVLFQKKFLWAAAALVAAISVMLPIWNFLQAKNLSASLLISIGIATGIVVLAITYIITQRSKRGDEK